MAEGRATDDVGRVTGQFSHALLAIAVSFAGGRGSSVIDETRYQFAVVEDVDGDRTIVDNREREDCEWDSFVECHRAGRAVDERWADERGELARHHCRARDVLGPAQLEHSAAAVGARNDVGVEDCDQSVEVPLASGREVRIDNGPLTSQVGVRLRRGVSDTTPGAARKLPGRLGRAIDERCDLVERHAEHVVQHEGESLCRAQRVENDLERDSDGLGEEGLVLWIGAGVGRDDRLGCERIQGIFVTELSGPQGVQANPRDYRGQPSLEVVDPICVDTLQSQPRVLHRVVGVAQRSDDPVGNRPQPPTLLIKPLGQVELIHVTSPPGFGSHQLDPDERTDVTGGDPMSRIQGVPQDAAGPTVKLVYWFMRRGMTKMTGRPPARGSGIEPVEIWAHRPKMMSGMGKFQQAVRKGNAVEERLKNLVELKGAEMIGCEFCVDLGSQICRNSGLSDQELLALPEYRQSELFTEREKLALDYAVGVMRTPVDVSDELFSRLKDHFSDGELVEITALLTVVNLDRFNAAFAVGSAGFSEGMVCVRPDRPRSEAMIVGR
jgi:alkylhydroperoxidase family enzyme